METTPTVNLPAPAKSGDLQAQIDSLRSLVNTILVLVIVVSGTLNIYFWRQFRSSKTDLTNISQQASVVVKEYEAKNGPAIDEFLRKIAEYGRTHPDFEPIMKKYQLNQLKPAPAAAPAPAKKQPGTGG